MSWRGIITALDAGTAFRSRISPYLHPLAGRPVLWHPLVAMLRADPPPVDITILHRGDMPSVLPPELPLPVAFERVAAGDDAAALRRLVASAEVGCIADGAAPLLTAGTVSRMVRAATGPVVRLADGGEPVAVAGPGVALAAGDDPRDPAVWVPAAGAEPDETLRVRTRADFTRAGVRLRDRYVAQLQEHGVTVLLPETVWVDADVLVGADTLIYPGVVLEGQTEIGSECVIGPHSRIIESRIGRGVELKGWNYVARTSIRNHAVIDPYVRRGYD